MNEKDLAFNHFPVIMFDRMEPFLPSRVGYVVLRQPSDSRVDHKRRTGTPAAIPFNLPGLSTVIEYGIWWDWDIEHLYELEAAWVFLNGKGEYLRVEASWHGNYNEMKVDGRIPLKEGRPLLFSQPGKHAFAPTPDWFLPRERAEHPCLKNAGSGGVHVTPLLKDRIRKNPKLDRLAAGYLGRKAFAPCFDFVKEWRMPREAFVPWEELRRWIPLRVGEILARLEGGMMP